MIQHRNRNRILYFWKTANVGVCNEDGTRVIDWLGLVFVFLGIGLTGIGNSLFYR
jgi:hypothetical protein